MLKQDVVAVDTIDPNLSAVVKHLDEVMNWCKFAMAGIIICQTTRVHIGASIGINTISDKKVHNRQ
jgi:hypothetical protein